MYTAREIFSEADYEYCKRETEKKENWTLIKQPGRQIKIEIAGRQLFPTKDKNYVGIWNGDYLVHFREEHSLHGDIGGKMFAVEEFEWLDSWETFCDYLDKRICRGIPGHEEEGQISLF